MLTVNEAKIKAAKLLIEKYGMDFVRDNVNKRLFTSVIDLEESFQVNFELFENSITFKHQDVIDNKEDIFPEILMSVNVDKTLGTVKLNDLKKKEDI